MNQACGWSQSGKNRCLGQSTKLRQLTRVPRTEAEKDEALKLLKQTAGYVLSLRRMFSDFWPVSSDSIADRVAPAHAVVCVNR